MEHHHRDTPDRGPFPTSTEGLPEADTPRVINLGDGETAELRIGPVTKRIGDQQVRMLAYSGSIPGPTLRVQEGSQLVVDVENQGDLDATVHWHGLRLDNRYDGTHETQTPMPPGGSFSYRLDFPDPGIYWYHPHIRQDYGQEMGLYGNIIVVPNHDDYWPAAHREIALTLDDVLIEDGKVAQFDANQTNYSAMGRFGNTMLTGGETELALTVRKEEVIRFYLTNTANTRVFNIATANARMKLVGADSGRYERETWIDSVILAPSERAVVDVLFDQDGDAPLEHRTPEHTYRLGTITVSDEQATPSLTEEFSRLRHNPEWAEERKRIAPYVDAEPDKTLGFIAEMDMGEPEGDVVYACPMHADVVSDEPGHCPKCGMKLLATAVSYVCPMHPDVASDTPDKCPKCGMKLLPAHLVAASEGGHEHDHGDDEHDHDEQYHDDHGEHHHDHTAVGAIEWEDDMVDVNRITTPANTRWSLVDKDTGDANHAIDWQFRVGDQVKLRLVNEMDSDHPMHHPFHVHGAGRFIILSRDGVPEENLVWKDTVLIRTGETVDILLDVTHPGRWMAHCHIAEHHESGMMFSFNVSP
ncbi:MAG TPA: multicopper oxidase family protein [Gaiellales bacterium]|jgi:FtsP/CotA-like multicopper oxidase with cupredoxin domain|nr:multicopper oxidase family protein [Gaiellales bacterium]